MKNSERPEVQTYLIKFLTQTGYGETCFKEALFMYGMPYNKHKRKAWLMSEYVEPHKWEPWELEAMKHIDKMISKIHKYVNGYDFQSNDSRMCVVNLIDLFPSMEVGEEINIDEELERYGMHR